MQQTATTTRLEAILLQLGTIQRVALMNLDGVSHEASLTRPTPGGNSVNWLAGHIVRTRQRFLSGVGAFAADAQLDGYTGGANPGLPLEDLIRGLEQSYDRFREGISGLSEADLEGPAPFTPGPKPMTVFDLLATMMFHESYHVGQIGSARRAIGLKGAV